MEKEKSVIELFINIIFKIIYLLLFKFVTLLITNPVIKKLQLYISHTLNYKQPEK